MRPDVRREMAGAFDLAPEDEREAIKNIMAFFHFRDGKKYGDGSLGTIYISPKELRDLMAWWKG